ncbi:MAG: hypothetical protein U1E54_04515, partial [Candidatus Levybacteria bacterium]|nr:hypothetical protein [Candidatus Levybacteria bacterium]
MQAGQSLVEIILAIGLSAIILPALLVGLVSSREGRAQQSQRTQATYLLNETVDAVRSVREKGWTSFAVNGTYHPVVSGSGWSLATGSATVNGFTQSITVGDINRDSNGVIVSSDGILDPSTKKVDVLITWGQPYLSKIDTTLFITRYLDNNAFVQTTVGDFNLGTKSGTIITDTSGGEVTLGAGGRGNWCAPNLSIAALDLPKNGVANALTVIEGRAFAGTGNNASGVSFANIPITTTYPPVASIAGTLSGYKTNGIFGESDYAYITTDNNFKEMVIIDLTNLIGDTYSEVGYFDAPGNNSGRSVYVIDNIGYVTVDNILYSVNLSAKNGSRPYLDSVSLVGNGTKVFVVGDYAYVATSSTGTQLQIIDVSNPNDMVVV